MFNGIIKDTGKIYKIQKNGDNCNLVIYSKIKFSKQEIGSSISCSGACLTLDSYKKNLSRFYLSKETMDRTVFQFSKKGDIINLEKSLKFGERMSGHFIQGHIDTISKIKRIDKIGKTWLVTFAIGKNFKKYIVEKGSIAVNGISLTISKLLSTGFQIAVIPQTLKNTNLYKVKKNNFVNIEFDILSKYLINRIK
tara:strand:- start:6005 stop:6589 length:585 start_codon:yes stop_codon:yes gene_type:complete